MRKTADDIFVITIYNYKCFNSEEQLKILSKIKENIGKFSSKLLQTLPFILFRLNLRYKLSILETISK